MTRWLAAALLLAALAAPAPADPVLRWSPADGTVPVDGEITLSVMLDEALPVRTIELYIEYDDSLVTTVSGGPGALFNGFSLFQGFAEVDSQNPGEWHGYCVILGASDWTTGPGELFRWTVRGDVEGLCDVTTSEITLLPPGGGSYSGTTLPPTTITVGDDLTAVPLDSPAVASLLVQPNPFNPRTTVSFMLPAAGSVLVAIYDARGQMVVRLVGETLGSGAHSIDWDGRDAYGAAMPSGTYFCRLTTPWGTETRKMGLLR